MVKRLISVGMVVLGLFWLGLTLTQARSGGWVTDDLEYWTITAICRDGARITLIHENSRQPTPPLGSNDQILVTLQPRLLTRPYDPAELDAQGNFIEAWPLFANYPLLGASQTLSATTYQANPLAADIDNNGTIEAAEQFYLHTTGIIQWARRPAVGSVVLLPSANPFSPIPGIVGQIEDCYLAPIPITPTIQVEPVQFGTNYSAFHPQNSFGQPAQSLVQPEALIYKIEALPIADGLSLGAASLTAGSTFSRADLESHDFRYTQSIASTRSDRFRFSVQATYTGTLDSSLVGGKGQTVSRFGTYTVTETLMAGLSQIAVADGLTGCTTLVSVNTTGISGNGDSLNPTMSADGRFIAFQSNATNLVANDTNDLADIFVHDRDPDGDYNFYQNEATCTAGPSDTFRVSTASNGAEADGPSSNPLISANGDFVEFSSEAQNLVSTPLENGVNPFIRYIGFTADIEFVGAKAIYLPLVQR